MAGVQRKDVWDAADALLVAGDRPSVEKVRQRLGRGSPNTVGPHLDAWFKSLGARIHPGGFAPPPDVPGPIAAAAKHFWEAALSEARALVEAAHRDTQAEQAKEWESIAEARREVLNLEAICDAREKAAGDALREAQATLELERERVRKAEAARASMEGEVGLLRRALEAAQSQQAADRQRFDEQRRAADTRLDEERRRWAGEVDQARTAARQAQSQADGREVELRRVKEALGKANEAALQADARRSITERELDAAKEEARRSAKHAASLEQALARSGSQFARLAERIRRVEAKRVAPAAAKARARTSRTRAAGK